jgi:hypothetical protein
MKNVTYAVLALLVVLLSNCKKDDPDPMKELSDDITTGLWKISQLVTDDLNLTMQYETQWLVFTTEKAPESPSELFNRLILTDGSHTVHGTWIFIAGGPEEDCRYFLSVAFIQNSELEPVSARWGIESHSKGRLRLVKPVQEHSSDLRFMLLERK